MYFSWVTKAFKETDARLLWETAKSVTRENVISLVVAKKYIVLAQYRDFQIYLENFNKALKVLTEEKCHQGGQEIPLY